MASALGSRHASTLNGTLLPPSIQPDVTILLEEAAACSPAWQAATWLLTELVARGVGHARSLTVVVGEARAALALPGVTAGSLLSAALVARAAAIKGVPVVTADAPSAGATVVRIGPGTLTADLEVVADDWAGGVRTPGQAPGLGHPAPTLLLGALVGASHAAGALFRLARLAKPAPPGVWHDAWTLTQTSLDLGEPSDGPVNAPIDLNPIAVAGMGAVANAFAVALLTHAGATGTLRAADFDVVDESNLNRCLLFVQTDLGHPKADTANSAAAGIGGDRARLQVNAGKAETAFGAERIDTLISAVDNNRARSALARLCARAVLTGSTYQLRTEITILGEPAPCLRCFNPPEPVEPDRNVKARVKAASVEELESMAARTGKTAAELQEWAHTPDCGELDAAVLPALRETGPPAFSVGFVSALTGVLLAATAIRTQSDPPSRASSARAQLLRPGSRRQHPATAPLDPLCPECGPGKNLPTVWRALWS